MADLPDSLGTYLSSLPELRDPNRRRALYGALPLKSVNEGAYRDRVVFWKSAISGALQKGFFGPRTVLAVTRELPQRLQSCEGIIPKCIPGVLNQLVQDSKLIELDTFFNVRGSGGLWIRGLVSPFRWLWSIARPYEDESVPSELPVGQFVDMDGVEVLKVTFGGMLGD